LNKGNVLVFVKIDTSEMGCHIGIVVSIGGEKNDGFRRIDVPEGLQTLVGRIGLLVTLEKRS
jgi:hypothetical protein